MTPYGTIPTQQLQALIARGQIRGRRAIASEQIQPATLDLTLGARGWRVAASFLPRPGESVQALLARFALYELDLTRPTILERDAIYILELNEALLLPAEVDGATENKSSTGRIDLQTRLVADGVSRFDRVPKGYTGPLYVEVTPRSFLVELISGIALNQLRLFRGDGTLSNDDIEAAHARDPLLLDRGGQQLMMIPSLLDGGILLSLDLDQEVVGYRAKRTNAVLSLVGDPMPSAKFFEPILRPTDGHLLLRKGDFYILSSRERFRVPPQYSVQMAAYDTASGEFRSHYAGFFDPGFGYGDGSIPGASAVLEIRSHGDDFLLRDAQPVCKMVFTHMVEVPTRVYGLSKEIAGRYAAQVGPRLSKYVQA